ncbi:MAG: alpha/beta hydrolase [Ilumatobacteraceae bacterium]
MNRRQRSQLGMAATRTATRLAASSPVDVLALTRNPLVAATLEGGIRYEADVRALQACAPGGRGVDKQINVHDGGAGPAIVLVQGWTASGLVWPAAMVAELERTHRVVRVDNRGSGWSRRAPRPYTISGLARDVRDAIDRLDLGRPIVAGLSMGGMITQELALRWPDRVGRIVLMGTKPPSPQDVPPPLALTARLLASPPPGVPLRTFLRDMWAEYAAPGFAESQPDMIEEMADSIAQRPTPRFAVLDQARAVGAWHGSGRLTGMTVPTTVVHGTEDPLIPVANGMRISRLVPGARYIELEGVGHLVPYEAPTRTAAIIRGDDGF